MLDIIRKILQKIILPIRKKKEEFLSNFRFSMAFRISMAYLRLLLTHGILFMAGFFLLYMLSEKAKYDQMSQDIIVSITDMDGAKCVNPYYMLGLSMRITNTDTGEELYNDISYFPAEEKAFFNRIYYNRKDRGHILIIDSEEKFTLQGVTYLAQFQYDLTRSYIDFFSLLWKMVLLYLGIVCLIIRKGIRSDIRLFEPLRIMSATANRLTVNNLHSERLNIEGTKNELKDLATVINAMLDRIETSYESQKQFVSDASHELRTPIAVIQGYANLLNRWGTTNEEVLHESIEAIQNEARSMQDLVEKLLFLSRHDKKTLKLTKKRFNMRLLIEDMVKETKLVAANRIINAPIMEDVIVYGDKQSIKQAIRIFIDNAVKYTKDGDEITILCQKINEDCVITIQDTGIGMTRNDVDHIFDRFYRSDNVRNQNISGHGLGLSLAKLIILAHTGKIKVRSQYKKGSSFIITLPKRRF
ncbi:HAMP domain-containing histidine kinase [Lachnospiraceae bacterium MD1]|uniref:histidine kinase n=1 Tax=Variimorphobacter saccharofermentans TaxID=2755051 RepID=A0A839K6B8_9FIRM|nr:HAMP domain-containing sensor histidine kinase [Variimorphobacter saccharofermentans]MBB2184722.1 HAMP domain-containing histidine kinase [Variimorphobacter saccharofermentans]